MEHILVLMFFVILLSSVYEFKKMTIKRFSYETKPEIMKINISVTFISNEFTANLDQWVFINSLQYSVSD